MGLLSWIIVGALAGMLAGIIVRGGGFGFLADVVVGVVGACIGGAIAVWGFHSPDPMNGINVTSILVATVGAIILIAFVRIGQSTKRHRR